MTTLVISNVFPPTKGGSGRWFWELYRRLPRADFFVAAGACEGDAAFDATHDLRLNRVPLQFDSWGVLGRRSLGQYAWAWRSLAKIVRCEHIRAVHAGVALPEGLLAWSLKRRFRLRYAVYVHGEELQVYRTSRELRWLARRVYAAADLLIANSENTARLLRESWPCRPDRIHVMHPGVDTEYFHPAPYSPDVRAELGWGDRRVVLTVGRLQKRKGHDVMIQALSQLREQLPDILYAIVGDGEERPNLEQLVASLNLREHVIFHGRCDDDLIRKAYQQCDLFVLPNREVDGDFEGFGIVLLEAQACGKPVIAGNSGGTAESVSLHCGNRVIDCTSPTHLVESIGTFLSSTRGLRELTPAHCSDNIKGFSWSAAVQRMLAVSAIETRIA